MRMTKGFLTKAITILDNISKESLIEHTSYSTPALERIWERRFKASQDFLTELHETLASLEEERHKRKKKRK